MKHPKIDQRLQAQLAAPAASQQSVEAMITLNVDVGRGLALEGYRQHVQTAAEQVIERVQKQVGSPPRDFYILANIGALAVSATASFISALIRQPEVASATAGEQGEDVLIRPVAKRPVSARRLR